MSIFTATDPSNTEAVKLGAQRIREMKTILNTLLGVFFTDSLATWQANVIPGSAIKTGEVTATQLGTGAVTAGKIGTDAVVTAKIQDAAVTNAKLSLSTDGIPLIKISATSLLQYQNAILNGSFEDLTSSLPDRWTLAVLTNGAYVIDTSASGTRHGAAALKFTQITGASNGGGTATMIPYFEVAENEPFLVSWLHKSSSAGIHNKCEIFWFSEALVATATASTTLYDSVANPTSWTRQEVIADPPTGAKYAQLKITGGVADTNTGGTVTSHWDDVRVGPVDFSKSVSFTVPATYSWTSPSTPTIARVKVWGAGGSGGGGAGGGPGGGGGGGEYAEKIVQLAASTAYAVIVGAGASGVTGSLSGVAGGNSSFNSTTVKAFGGSGGGRPTGGAGGSGGTGTILFSGANGFAASGNAGGIGGACLKGIVGAPASPSGGSNSVSAGSPGGGGGGGGGGGANTSSSSGGDGKVVIEYL